MPVKKEQGTFDDRDVYFELVQKFPLRPIKTDGELQAASEVVDGLLDCESLDDGAEDYLEVLTNLIRDYEKIHHAIPPLPDRELLRQLIAGKEVTQQDVANATGIVYSTISAVLAGRRHLTREQIGKLCRYFGVSPDVFSFPSGVN